MVSNKWNLDTWSLQTKLYQFLHLFSKLSKTTSSIPQILSCVILGYLCLQTQMRNKAGDYRAGKIHFTYKYFLMFYLLTKRHLGPFPVVKKRFLIYNSPKNLPKSMSQASLMASWLKYHLSKQLQTFSRFRLRRQQHKLAPPGSCSGRGSHRQLFCFEYMHSALGHSSRFFF